MKVLEQPGRAAVLEGRRGRAVDLALAVVRVLATDGDHIVLDVDGHRMTVRDVGERERPAGRVAA